MTFCELQNKLVSSAVICEQLPRCFIEGTSITVGEDQAGIQGKILMLGGICQESH